MLDHAGILAFQVAARPIPSPSPYTLVAFGAYMAGVFLLGALAHHLLERGSFLKEYFLGDRKLNAWVLGLTYVATSVSAGSFVGFPSLIYRYGWIMAVWIAGYMVAGLVSKGVLAKRLNQVSRISGAITVPDVLRDRFQSPLLGLLASVFLLFFLLFNLVGQFKAGGLIMRQASEGIADTSGYQSARAATVGVLKVVRNWDPDLSQKKYGSFYGEQYPDYVLGIFIFALTVVAYTTYGGFWAVTWTDVLQGIVIVVGAVLLMVLALVEVGGLERASHTLQKLDPKLMSGPGPDDYLQPALAVSFFILWTLGSMGQPVGMVRLMACRDTPTLRISLFMIGFYYFLIYMPLVVTFICARAMYPTEFLQESDKVMPAMALAVTQKLPLLGGLILAAPYAAAMSAVAGFLLLMSSSLVRDIYQRNINPTVSPQLVRWVSYGTTAVVGIIVMFAALQPPRYLQYLIIFTGAGMACTYLAPVVLGLYWRRTTRPAALISLVSGFLTVSLLWLFGIMGYGKEGKIGAAAESFAPVYYRGLDPVVYGMVTSFVLGIAVSLITKPPPRDHVDKYFLADSQ